MLECASYLAMVFGAIVAMVSWIGLLVSAAFMFATTSAGALGIGCVMFGGTLCAGMSIFFCSYCWISDQDD